MNTSTTLSISVASVRIAQGWSWAFILQCTYNNAILLSNYYSIEQNKNKLIFQEID